MMEPLVIPSGRPSRSGPRPMYRVGECLFATRDEVDAFLSGCIPPTPDQIRKVDRKIAQERALTPEQVAQDNGVIGRLRWVETTQSWCWQNPWRNDEE